MFFSAWTIGVVSMFLFLATWSFFFFPERKESAQHSLVLGYTKSVDIKFTGITYFSICLSRKSLKDWITFRPKLHPNKTEGLFFFIIPNYFEPFELILTFFLVFTTSYLWSLFSAAVDCPVSVISSAHMESQLVFIHLSIKFWGFFVARFSVNAAQHTNLTNI